MLMNFRKQVFHQSKHWDVKRLVGTSRSAKGIMLAAITRKYHSYPDPDEKPKISTFRSSGNEKREKKGEALLSKQYRMDESFPGSPTPTGIKKESAPIIRETKLTNGLIVTSQELPGSLMVTLGFMVKCGSAYEQQIGQDTNLGVTHFLELNAFRSTLNRTHDDVIKELEKIGASAQCISLRENIFYCIDVLKENVEVAMDILADTILNPTFPEQEMEETCGIVDFQAMELPTEVFSRDLVQRAAYEGSALGNRHYCPVDAVQAVTVNQLQHFRNQFFNGSNCILSVVGLNHEELMKIVEPRFSALAVTPSNIVRPACVYKGSLQIEERELKDPSFVKVCMAFEVGGWKSPNLVPMCVIQTLLGGGSSFSAGGPGKGMYTRLYTQVLNRHFWAEAVESFTAINEDCGLLGIDTACPPDFVSNAIIMVIDQFTSLARNPVTNEELTRAKNMLKSMMMMNLESRLMICEDTVRQYATYGQRRQPIDLCHEIDKVTASDLMRVARLMLSKPPSLAIVGKGMDNIPSYQDLVAFTKAKSQL